MSRVPRIYRDARLAPGEAVMLDETATTHALRVLRLRIGDPVVLFNGDGRDYKGRLAEAGRHSAVVEIGSAGPVEPPAVLPLHLVLGVSRGQRMDFALQKATELGVTEITPVVTARSVVRFNSDKRARRTTHWRRVVINACEQCGRRRLPTAHAPQELAAWLDGWQGGGILLDPDAPDGLGRLPAPTAVTALLVGPEGGMTPDERARATAAGFRGVRLGPRILRTETAPLAAISAMQALWGDFR